MEESDNEIKGKEIIQYLITIQDIIWKLNEENIEDSIRLIINLFSDDFPYSFNLALSQSIYSTFVAKSNDFEIYLNFMKAIEIKEKEIKDDICGIFEIFLHYMIWLETQESDYLLEQMIEHNLIDSRFVINKKTLYFAHLKTRKELNSLKHPIWWDFFKNIKKFQKDDWKIHKEYIH